jgi:protein phosphatase
VPAGRQEGRARPGAYDRAPSGRRGGGATALEHSRDSDADDEDRDEAAEAGERALRPRRLTTRLVVFLIGIVAVLAVAGVAVAWFATRTYFVGFQGEQVVIYKGRPGGLLWFEPSVAERSDPPITKAVLAGSLCNRVEGQPSAASLGDARRIVEQLRADQGHLPAPAVPCGGSG